MAEKAGEGVKPGGRQFYVVWMSAAAAPEPSKPSDEIRDAHHDYLAALEAQGVLFAAGPFRDRLRPPPRHPLGRRPPTAPPRIGPCANSWASPSSSA